MTIRTKSQRKIHVNGKNYTWHVAINKDGEGKVLHVASADKKMILMYPLAAYQNPYVVVLGSEFEGAETGGVWRRFKSPPFSDHETVRPSHVRNMIEWASSSDIKKLPYEFKGSLIL